MAEVDQKHFSKAPTSKELAEFTFKAMKKGKVTAIHGLKNNLLVLSARTAPRKMVTAVAAKVME